MGQPHGKPLKSIPKERIRTPGLKPLAISPSVISIVHRSINEIKERRLRSRVVENFIIIWLDSSIIKKHGDIKYTIEQLQTIVNTIRTFTDPIKCFEAIKLIENERIFLISSGQLGSTILPLIQNLNQVDSMFIFCLDKAKYEPLAQQYSKVKGIFSKIESICKRIGEDVRQGEQVLMPISIIGNDETHELDLSFVYSQLLKETLLKFHYNERVKNDLIAFCRQQYAENPRELEIIEEFEEKYDQPSPIWWYTRECFIYSMINKALRADDMEVIMRMGFIIRDLHRQIESLHLQSNIREPFVVFRGQGLSNDELEKIRSNPGDLFSFNNFLSTSTVRDVALVYTRRTLERTDLPAILFEMHIDPRQCSTPFASLDNFSYYEKEEKEILFSIHTVFRIGQVQELQPRFWQIQLTLVTDHDEQIQSFQNFIRREMNDSSTFNQLGKLLIRMKRYDRAEEIYSLLLERTPENRTEDFVTFHHQLGWINDLKGNLLAAKSHYEYALQTATAAHPLLSMTHSNIGIILRKQGNHSAALRSLQQALQIEENKNNKDRIRIARLQNEIALVFKDQGEYLHAIDYFKRSATFFRDQSSSLSAELVQIYRQLGETFDLSDDKLTALIYYEQAARLEEETYPLNYSSLAEIHHAMAVIMEDLHRYEDAVDHIRTSLNCLREDPRGDSRFIEIYSNYLEQLISKTDCTSIVVSSF